MRVYVLSSGSNGNVAVVEVNGTRILVDAGLNPTDAAGRMRVLGADLFPRSVDGIVVTHHHGDHIAHVEGMARATRATTYLHDGIQATRLRAKFPVVRYDPGTPFRVGAIDVQAIWVPHDAPQVALRFSSVNDARAFVLATDVGHPTRPMVEMLCTADGALLEANYCPTLLAMSAYPPRLQARVAGPFGHLSNDQAAELVGRASRARLRAVWLAHLSDRNNSPERARAAVRTRAGDVEVHVIPHAQPRLLEIEPRATAPSGLQLALAFAPNSFTSKPSPDLDSEVKARAIP